MYSGLAQEWADDLMAHLLSSGHGPLDLDTPVWSVYWDERRERFRALYDGASPEEWTVEQVADMLGKDLPTTPEEE